MSDANEGYRWRILAMVYLALLAFALVFQSIPPVLGLIIKELRITHAQAGLLMGLLALPGIFLAIPSGLLSDYYGAKRVGAISLVLMVIGTALSGTAREFLTLAVGRLVAGIGALTLAVVGPQILSQWFYKKEVGLAMGFLNTAMPLGTVVAFNFFGRLGSTMDWRIPILLTTALSLVALFVFLMVFKSAPGTEDRRSSFFMSPFKAGAKIWLVGIAWMWFNAGVIAFLTFAPDYFVSRGYELASAGFLTSILMLVALFLNPIIGYTSHRIGSKELFIAAGGISIAGIVLSISFSGLPVLPLMMLLGIAAAFVPAPIFSLPSDILPPEKLGMGFGIITTLLNVGILLGPYLVGLTIDITGGFQSGFLLMAGFALMTTPTILLLRILK